MQILFSYPPDKAVDPAIVSYCFPHGVQPSLLERTPSMSALNELVYSQQYAHDDAVSFVFLQKVLCAFVKGIEQQNGRQVLCSCNETTG